MPTQTTRIAAGATNANTEIDISDQLDKPMDTRGGVDPIADARLVDESGGTATDLTSIGQGATGDPGAGEIAVISATSIALGDALADADNLVVSYEPRTEHEVPV